MARTKILRDGHGLFIHHNGAIYRPVVSTRAREYRERFKLVETTAFTEGDEVKTQRIQGYPLCTLESKELPATELWSMHADLYGWSPDKTPVIMG